MRLLLGKGVVAAKVAKGRLEEKGVSKAKVKASLLASIVVADADALTVKDEVASERP